MRIVLQKFFVVIHLDHERLHLAQALKRQARRLAQIGDVTERARPGVKGEPDRLERIGADRFRGQGIAINRDRKFSAENLEPADVVPMLVGEKDTVEFVRRDPAEREPEDELTRAQTAIDEESAMVGRDERAIPRASAPEHGQTKHPRYVATRFPLHKWKARAPRRAIDFCARLVTLSRNGSARCRQSPARI